MKIKILYEDANILAIDKPSGISVHGDGRTKEKTLVDWILKNYPKMKNVGEAALVNIKGKEIKIPRPGIVHRLDKETSGVMLLAKNQKAYEFLKNQFQERVVRKVYVAIVSGSVKNERGTVNKPIGRSPTDFRRRLAGRGVRGELKEAVTEYKVIKRFTSLNLTPSPSPGKIEGRKIHEEKYTYVELRPKTGRTHQIRVHMKFLNHPVVCDSLYNPGKPYPKGITHLALHAKSIEFKDLKGESVKVESPIPLEFKKVIQ